MDNSKELNVSMQKLAINNNKKVDGGGSDSGNGNGSSNVINSNNPRNVAGAAATTTAKGYNAAASTKEALNSQDHDEPDNIGKGMGGGGGVGLGVPSLFAAPCFFVNTPKITNDGNKTLTAQLHQQQQQQLQRQQQQQQLFATSITASSALSASAPFANASVADKRKMVHELCQQLVLSDEQINELCYRILHEIKRGLCKATNPQANVKCFITYVQDLPNGNERGKFLALDLGGTNFRVLLIHLKEEHDFQMESRIYAIPQHIMVGSGTQLFDHIAECLANFMNEHNVYKERLPLGFTFSFPLRQLGLTKGLLETWTKGFNCDGVVDQDVVQLLKDAIARRGDVQIDVCAILNDTTGTLMSCAWKNRNCKIGLIVGTGANACYVERVEEAEMFEPNLKEKHKPHVLVNTEWGAFGDNGALDFVRTEFDEHVDKHSINPGKQTFEKMISGMYMGELARLAIVKMVQAGVLFKGQDSDVLNTRGMFFTKYVSEIEADEPGTYTNCRLVLDELGLTNATDDDCENVRVICECVSRRAAHLVSAGIATLINKMNEPHVTVGVDGSVYRFHPKFHNLMVEKISQLIKPSISFDLMLSEDGSGRGAALVAAVACREDNPKPS